MPDFVDNSPEHAKYAALLEEHGVSATPQRVAIAAVLLARPQHLSADQILAEISAGPAPRVSKATVYNTLNLFVERGLVREVAIDPSRLFYDSTVTPHHHIYNIDTGELADVQGDDVMLAGLPKLPAGTVADSVQVIIRVRNQTA